MVLVKMSYIGAVKLGEHLMLIMKDDLFTAQLLATLKDRQEDDHMQGVDDDDQRHYAIDDIILALERPVVIEKESNPE